MHIISMCCVIFWGGGFHIKSHNMKISVNSFLNFVIVGHPEDLIVVMLQRKLIVMFLKSVLTVSFVGMENGNLIYFLQ